MSFFRLTLFAVPLAFLRGTEKRIEDLLELFRVGVFEFAPWPLVFVSRLLGYRHPKTLALSLKALLVPAAGR